MDRWGATPQRAGSFATGGRAGAFGGSLPMPGSRAPMFGADRGFGGRSGGAAGLYSTYPPPSNSKNVSFGSPGGTLEHVRFIRRAAITLVPAMPSQRPC